MIARGTFIEIKKSVYELHQTKLSAEVLAEIKILFPAECEHFTTADVRRIAAGSETVLSIISELAFAD